MIQRIRAGYYRHLETCRFIVRTDGWEGPRGGKYCFWELATEDRLGLTIDGDGTFNTLREAAEALDREES